MKKILSIVLCVTFASAFAENEPPAAELGTIGVTAITTSFSNTIVAISYDDLEGGAGMVYSNLVKTANLTEGDRLVEFRNDIYTGWVLEKSGNVLYWKETKGSFLDASGNQINLVGSAANEVRGTVGAGIWLVRQNPTDGNVAKPFYIYGKLSTNMISTTVAGKWTLIGNPTQGEVEIGVNTVAGASDGDQIVVPVAPNGNLCYYTFHSTAGWQRTSVKNGVPVFETDLTLGAGLGCWIKTAKDATITW